MPPEARVGVAGTLQTKDGGGLFPTPQKNPVLLR